MSIARKAARQAVAALLDTLPELEAVYDHSVADFHRKSPVAMVHSAGTIQDGPVTFGDAPRTHALLISLWWRRTETTEDSIDDLSEAVFDLLEANEENDAWGLLRIDDDFSEMDYPIIDGVQYRLEVIRVVIW